MSFIFITGRRKQPTQVTYRRISFLEFFLLTWIDRRIKNSRSRIVGKIFFSGQEIHEGYTDPFLPLFLKCFLTYFKCVMSILFVHRVPHIHGLICPLDPPGFIIPRVRGKKTDTVTVSSPCILSIFQVRINSVYSVDLPGCISPCILSIFQVESLFWISPILSLL